MSYGQHVSLNPGHRITLGDLRQFLADHGDLPDGTEIAATIAYQGWPGKQWTLRMQRNERLDRRGWITRLTLVKPEPEEIPADG